MPTAIWSTRVIDTVAAKFPMYVLRGIGEVLFLLGAITMCVNLWKTVTSAPAKVAVPMAVAAEQGAKRAFRDKLKMLERNATLLLVFSFLVVSIGGVVQIAPLVYLQNTIEGVAGKRPYSPLELARRDIHVRKGCYACHSQMIRPMRDEVERHGHYSLAAASHR